MIRDASSLRVALRRRTAENATPGPMRGVTWFTTLQPRCGAGARRHSKSVSCGDLWAQSKSMMVEKTCDNPVFVVGMNGSGTSMLTECLGRHPELYAFPGETRMIPHFIKEQARFGDLNEDGNFRAFWDYINQSVPDFRVFNNQRPPDLPDDWQSHPRSLAGIIDAIFRGFAAQYGKSRWCEKSPNHSEHILSLGALFPSSKFVHIVRDGRDCAASTNRRQYRNPNLAIYRWRRIVAEAKRQGTSLRERYFELRYEDLTSNPEHWMREICAFLDLPFDARVLESTMPQSAKGDALESGQVGSIEPNSRKYRRYFTAKQVARLERISGAFLRELGYETEYATGNKDIGRVRAAVTRLVDFVRGNRSLRRKLQGDSTMTWGRVYRRTLASIREYATKRN